MATRGTNFVRGRRFREAVSLQLRAMGLPDAQVRPFARRNEDPSGPQPDVQGIPQAWHVDVAADQHDRFSVRLDAAVDAAAQGGRQYAAVVLHRRDYAGLQRPVGDSFVLLRLEDFARILKRDADLEAAP